jgi:hypothetical protein
VGPANTAIPVVIGSPAQGRGPDSRIYVLFTDAAGTKAALAAATGLARGLGLPVELLAARVVPYPLPLDEPPVTIEFMEGTMSRLVVDLDTEVSVSILLCRDPNEALRNALGPDALVVIGGGKPKLARLLLSEGRRLIVIH